MTCFCLADEWMGKWVLRRCRVAQWAIAEFLIGTPNGDYEIYHNNLGPQRRAWIRHLNNYRRYN